MCLRMLEEDYAFAMWDWRTLNPMTSGCFTWITDFDQLVGVKRINTEWTHLQVREGASAALKCWRKRWDYFPGCLSGKCVRSVVSFPFVLVHRKCFNFRHSLM